MLESNKKKNVPWKWIAGALSLGFIVVLWVRKDLLAVCSSIPKEELLPVLASSVAVTLMKATLLVGVICLFRWIGGKIDTADNAS